MLASASPRRRELLAALGLTFEVRPADLDETPRPAESPRELVVRLAQEKAAAVVGAGELAIAADTVVVIDGEILGKPLDRRSDVFALGAMLYHLLAGVPPYNARTATDVILAGDLLYVGTQQGTIEVLPEVVKAVAGRSVVMVDGGFSRVVGGIAPAALPSEPGATSAPD